MKSYKAEELFDEQGRLMPELAELAPAGERRMGSNPHANGVACCAICECQTSGCTRVTVPSPGAVEGQDTLVLSQFPARCGWS